MTRIPFLARGDHVPGNVTNLDLAAWRVVKLASYRIQFRDCGRNLIAAFCVLSIVRGGSV